MQIYEDSALSKLGKILQIPNVLKYCNQTHSNAFQIKTKINEDKLPLRIIDQTIFQFAGSNSVMLRLWGKGVPRLCPVDNGYPTMKIPICQS